MARDLQSIACRRIPRSSRTFSSLSTGSYHKILQVRVYTIPQCTLLHCLAFFSRHPKDIDLYTGILAEIPLPDGLLGPVGSCIIADQFVRLKRGDRYWYETSDRGLRFLPGNELIKLYHQLED